MDNINIKSWLIHKLGGLTKKEILPPIKCETINPHIEKLRTYCIDKYYHLPEQVAIEKMAEEFLPFIKKKMKYKKEIKPDGVYYSAELWVVENFKEK